MTFAWIAVYHHRCTSSLNSPLTSAGSFGGGQDLVIAGSGFTDDVSVAVCDVECDVTDVTTTQVTCTTPAMEAGKAILGMDENILTVTIRPHLFTAVQFHSIDAQAAV